MENTQINHNKITNIAIGGFDGIHLAHQKLISNLDKNSALIVIENGYANLTPNKYRELFTTLPIYYFDLIEIKNLKPEQFINLLKEKFKNLNKIVVGYDFKFGQNASCDTKCLKNIFQNEVVVIDEVKLDDISVHSQTIRKLLINGDLTLANSYLNRAYQIQGVSIKGQGIAQKSLFATINIKTDKFLLPKHGVYATFTIIQSKQYKSITFIGHRQITNNSFAIETHLLDEDIEVLPNTKIDIKFIQFVRENKSFDSFELLKNQIKKDIQKTKTIL